MRFLDFSFFCLNSSFSTQTPRNVECIFHNRRSLCLPIFVEIKITVFEIFRFFVFFCQIRHFLQFYVAVASWVFTETSRNLHIIRPNRSALCLQFFVEIKIIVFEIFGFFMFLPKFVIFEKKFFSNLCGSGLCYRTTVLKYLNSPTCPHATIVFTDIHTDPRSHASVKSFQC